MAENFSEYFQAQSLNTTIYMKNGRALLHTCINFLHLKGEGSWFPSPMVALSKGGSGDPPEYNGIVCLGATEGEGKY